MEINHTFISLQKIVGGYPCAGRVSMIGILEGIIYAWLFTLIPAIAVALYTVMYSHVESELERKTGAGK
jgi:hypothetical protein